MTRVSEFDDEYGLGMAPEHRMLDLESETDELAKELLRASARVPSVPESSYSRHGSGAIPSASTSGR